MDLVSLLITVIGIMVLLGLYVMSRLFDQSPAKQSKKSIKIPIYTDADGNKLSSIKADIAAPVGMDHAHAAYSSQAQQAAGSTDNTNTQSGQHVLFIASPTSQSLDGNKIIVAMNELNLQLGKKDIYHYIIDNNSDSGNDSSLFSIANGIAPWTLTEADLVEKSTPGLSLIMQLPTPIDTNEAISVFVETGQKLAEAINGELQNAQQQIFLETDKELMLQNSADNSES